MSLHAGAYTVERLAPGSYDVLLGGALIASLVREVDRGGTTRRWLVDLLDEAPPGERPIPFTAQQHTFPSRGAALEWLGIDDHAGAAGPHLHGRGAS